MNRLSPEIMKDVFPLNNKISYNIKNRRIFHSRLIRSVTYGSETLPQLAPDHWELIPTCELIWKVCNLLLLLKVLLKNGSQVITIVAYIIQYIFQVGFVSKYIVSSIPVLTFISFSSSFLFCFVLLFIIMVI